MSCSLCSHRVNIGVDYLQNCTSNYSVNKIDGNSIIHNFVFILHTPYIPNLNFLFIIFDFMYNLIFPVTNDSKTLAHFQRLISP